ncbi:superoxide dismutase family protein [Bacillus sp. FJAT-50079]|uniref:superoxide dismutase family protein n=1 Tax=Bacillus sp. FJAT-50079 TaxID=2833577 RepID=UPI001BC93078|nr:superoxide dismutase family protein [Bacillus sp. FJAT-50079]MBS4210146.1 superoxide dismutase family protein [Bacillus sp. FJAT-50079]
MKKWLMFAMATVCCLFIVACSANEEVNPQATGDDAVPVNSHTPIEVDLINTKGDSIGKATLSETDKGVKIAVKAEGLEPGTKAIHIHETGKCVAPDFTSAGAHFNPGQREHGFENPNGFHAGDLPNIEVSAQGTVNAIITAPNVTLKQGENSLLDEDGSALVIHKKADDYKTDPAGNAGDRIVCGVIGK